MFLYYFILFHSAFAISYDQEKFSRKVNYKNINQTSLIALKHYEDNATDNNEINNTAINLNDKYPNDINITLLFNEDNFSIGKKYLIRKKRHHTPTVYDYPSKKQFIQNFRHYTTSLNNYLLKKSLIRNLNKPKTIIGDYNEIINKEDHIIEAEDLYNDSIFEAMDNVLRKQIKLIDKLNARNGNISKSNFGNTFEELLAEVERRPPRTDLYTKMTSCKVRVYPTIQTVIDETEVKKRLREDPLVKRILQMASKKRTAYLKQIERNKST